MPCTIPLSPPLWCGLSTPSHGCGRPHLTAVRARRPGVPPWKSCWKVTFSTPPRHLGTLAGTVFFFYPAATYVGSGILLKPLSDRNIPLAAFLSLQLLTLCPHQLTLTPWFQPAVGGTKDPCLQFLSSSLPYPLESQGPGSNQSSATFYLV